MASSLNRVRRFLDPRFQFWERGAETLPPPASILLHLTAVMLSVGMLAKALTVIFTAT